MWCTFLVNSDLQCIRRVHVHVDWSQPHLHVKPSHPLVHVTATQHIQNKLHTHEKITHTHTCTQ